MSPSIIDRLPTELYSAILSHVPSNALQQTVLSLTRALPLSPIPQHHLFESIRILHPDQAVRLNHRLRSGRRKQDKNSSGNQNTFDASGLIRKFSVETWQVDADVLINLIRMLPNLESLILWIGPSNFAPEHLEELFLNRMPNLRYLSLRFRPYVQKANYYQFLKGAYFDSTLLGLSAWPATPQSLPILSIVQDPFTPDPAVTTQRFAQPIVFFRLDLHLSLLIHSPFTSSLKSLRLRIPARPIVHPLTTIYRTPNPTPNTPAHHPAPLELLDISTCNVPESDLEALLIHFPHLKHLVLDECTSLLRGGSPQATGLELEWWEALGRRCALAGVKKAREREKKLRAWLEAASRNHVVEVQGGNHEGPPQGKRPRRGRKGLATATISLRASNSPPRAGPSTSALAGSVPRHYGPIPKVHIVPPLPSLRSLCMHPTSIASTPVVMNAETRIRVLAEFEQGWNDGLRVIWEKRGRLGMSFTRMPEEGVKPRFLRFKTDVDAVGSGKGEGEGFEGLEDVRPGDERMLFWPGGGEGSQVLWRGGVPVVCLAGSSREAEGHVEGCGHSVAWDTWEDWM
ncbi:hypothetical protein Hypma_016032 [Hypsizygus marmoreus]|uniref:F-box domain-containing protein n=1 Tax=Hypsizygus marmoreus TaxID=39966 RepID=A0A369K1G6_HYPMA|nr:hypothetical protein Hypma_016032 [Hypsizygus marmoreus]